MHVTLLNPFCCQQWMLHLCVRRIRALMEDTGALQERAQMLHRLVRTHHAQDWKIQTRDRVLATVPDFLNVFIRTTDYDWSHAHTLRNTLSQAYEDYNPLELSVMQVKTVVFLQSPWAWVRPPPHPPAEPNPCHSCVDSANDVRKL